MQEKLNDLESILRRSFEKYTLSNYVIPSGGITVSDGSSFFSLNKPVLIEKFDPNKHHECVKRLAIPINLLEKMVNNGDMLETIDNLAKQFELETGCFNYTFKRPDGEGYLRLLQESHGVEIRIYGYKHKGE